MMPGSGPSPTVRALALLFSTVVVGGLIGFTWEHAGYEAMQGVPDAMEPLLSEDLPAPSGRERRSPGEQAALQRALSHFPPYPRGGRPEVLATDYLGPRAPIAVAWLSTGDPPDRVLDHYREVLEERGLPAIGLRYNESAGFVGYWSPESEEVYLVSTLAQGGETLVFVSAGQVAPLLQGAGQLPGWLPLPPRLQQQVGLTLPLEGTAQYLVSGIIPASSPQEVADSYQSLLIRKGWSVEPPRPSSRGAVELEVRRGRLQGSVSLQRGPVASEVHLFLSFLERAR